MGDFGYVVLIIFVVIRVLIAAGLLYLIIAEVRRYKIRSAGKRKDSRADEDANGKDADDSSGSRN